MQFLKHERMDARLDISEIKMRYKEKGKCFIYNIKEKSISL